MGGRLPLLERDQLSPAQEKLYDYLVEVWVPQGEKAGFATRLPDGRFIGPFNGFLHVPEIAHALTEWGQEQSHSGVLSPEIRETVILAVGSVWKPAYELYAHRAAGAAAGLDKRDIESLAAGTLPENLDAPTSTAYRFSRSLAATYHVPDDQYAAALDEFGIKGVLAIVHLVGHYLTMSALLNAFRVPAPSPEM